MPFTGRRRRTDLRSWRISWRGSPPPKPPSGSRSPAGGAVGVAPSLEATERVGFACERGGADVVELGVPFSDPIADGPEIQRASQRALRGGARPCDVIALVSRLRR